MPSVPHRTAITRPGAVPAEQGAGTAAHPAEGPARALQQTLAHRWTPDAAAPAIALPTTSPTAPRIDAFLVASSRIAGPILFGAVLAGLATIVT